MKIYDCFLFYNELDLLDLRLAEHYEHVDHLVIVESTTTFQCNPKPLYLKDNWDRYKQYHDKIIHVIVDDAPGDIGHGTSYPTSSAWINESFQRNSIMRGLATAGHDDICIISDVDEILRAEVIDDLRTNPRDVAAFRTPYFNFKFNYMSVHADEKYCVWAVACRKKFLNNPDDFRVAGRFQLNGLPYSFDDGSTRMYEHAGWHFTYIGDDEFIRNKIKSFAHTELNQDSLLSMIHVDSMMARGVGFNPMDPRPFVPVAIDDYFPKALRDNLIKYQDRVISNQTMNATAFLPTE
jgi:hypothetical protein